MARRDDDILLASNLKKQIGKYVEKGDRKGLIEFLYGAFPMGSLSQKEKQKMLERAREWSDMFLTPDPFSDPWAEFLDHLQEHARVQNDLKREENEILSERNDLEGEGARNRAENQSEDLDRGNERLSQEEKENELLKERVEIERELAKARAEGQNPGKRGGEERSDPEGDDPEGHNPERETHDEGSQSDDGPGESSGSDDPAGADHDNATHADVEESERRLEDDIEKVERTQDRQEGEIHDLDRAMEEIKDILKSGKPNAHEEIADLLKDKYGIGNDDAKQAAINVAAEPKNTKGVLKNLGFAASAAETGGLSAIMGVLGSMKDKAGDVNAKQKAKALAKGAFGAARHTTAEGFFFFVTLILHIAVANFPGGGYPGSTVLGISQWTLVYLLIGGVLIALPYALWDDYHRKQSLIAVVVLAALAYALPAWAESFAPTDGLIDLTYWLVTLLPVWPLFFALRWSADSHRVRFWLKIYFIIVVLGIVFFFMADVWQAASSRLSNQVTPGGDTGDRLGGFWDGVKESVGRTWGGFFNLYNSTLNPQAYYQGRVEQNARGDLGIEITELRPLDPEFANDAEVIVYGTVYAKSFIEDRESVQIIPTCLIERDVAPEAAVNPIVLDVVFGTAGIFDCTFPPMPRGSYQVIAKATFPFQTWGYITYTFVDDERVRNLARQGLDVREELDILPEAEAIFTSGPVKIGMGGTPQPIRVDPENPPHYVPDGTRLGITLDQSWGGGILQRVDRIELKVPEPFEIHDCDRCKNNPDACSSEPDPIEPAYTNYVFRNIEFGPFMTFMGVTCELGITGSDAARRLVSEADKVQRSFVGTAYYEYTVDKTAMVRVR